MTPIPAISVIMPAYNAEAFLTRAVASLTAQTLQSWELIIVDDASTDCTVRVAQALSQADARIRVVVREQNGGPSLARNAGLALARGEWIAILDADDAMVPSRLQMLLAAAKQFGVDMIGDNQFLYDLGAGRLGRTLWPIGGAPLRDWTFLDHLTNDLPSSGAYYGWMKPLIRRHVIEAAHVRYRPQYRYGEDYLFYAELLLTGIKAKILMTPGYIYTTRTGEVSGAANNQSRTVASSAQLIDAMDLLVSLYQDRMSAPEQTALAFRRAQMVLSEDFVAFKSALLRQPHVALALLVRKPGLMFFLGRVARRLPGLILRRLGCDTEPSHGTPARA